MFIWTRGEATMSKRNKKRSVIKKKHRRMKQHELNHQQAAIQAKKDRHKKLVNYVRYHLRVGNFSVTTASEKLGVDKHTIYDVLRQPQFAKLYQRLMIDRKKLIFENGVDGRTIEYVNIDEAVEKTGYAASTIREALYMKKTLGQFKVYRKMNSN
ncbi:hypothetical protein FD45_GL001363 [Liquorilactobacillus nagelii DSM 13675]|nr:hypothetical protein FD45_GL001363 [Liquorilactobacillus nagelii DSM 13675]